jgi:hypothetical protein
MARVLYSHQIVTRGFDRAPEEVPVTTAVLSAMAMRRLEAVLFNGCPSLAGHGGGA